MKVILPSIAIILMYTLSYEKNITWLDLDLEWVKILSFF